MPNIERALLEGLPTAVETAGSIVKRVERIASEALSRDIDPVRAKLIAKADAQWERHLESRRPWSVLRSTAPTEEDLAKGLKRRPIEFESPQIDVSHFGRQENGRLAVPANLLWWKEPKLVSLRPDTWLHDAYENVNKATVRIEDSIGTHMGSGAFISKDGYFASAVHVLERSHDGNLVLSDGQKLPFKVLAFDSRSDAAVGRAVANPDQTFDFLELGSPFHMPSARTAAFGFPGETALPNSVVSPGRIHGMTIVDNAAPKAGGIWPHFKMRTWHGNSGGPIIDEDHKLVALVSSGNNPSWVETIKWTPPGNPDATPIDMARYHPHTTTGPSADHVRLLYDRLRSAPLRDDILQATSRSTPKNYNSARLVGETEMRELLQDPQRMRNLERRYKPQLQSANYWEDL